ncbi:mobile mystery protein A [bacterium]|nr:mobile mystery protein A [bacterium]
MRKTAEKLAREQLDRTLVRYRVLIETPPPRKGWIRAIRDVLGMSGQQLAKRTGLTRQRISAIEKQELDGSLTLRTLEKVAEGLDCTLVFALIPRRGLEAMLHQQVEQLVQRRLERSGHLMDLEAQGLSPAERRRAKEEMVTELKRNPPRQLWGEE